MISNLSLEGVSDNEIEEQLLDRPVSSLYDIAYIYGALDLLATKNTVESDISVEHLSYMTPNNDKVFDMYDTDDSLLTIDLVVDENDKSLSYDGVTIDRLTWKKSIKHGYSRPVNKAGRMIAHSVCQLSSQSGYDLDGCVSKLVDRVGRWPSSDEVQDAIENHEDSWIVDALIKFSDDNDVESLIKDDVAKCVGSKFTGLFSVRLSFPDEGWKLPGELDVMNEGMMSRKKDRLPSYSKADDSSGTGICYLTGEEGMVYGLPPGSPANFFTGQQKGLFWSLNPDNSVNQRPVSAQSALYLQKGSSILNLFERGITKNDKLTFYPYYNGEWDSDIARNIYGMIKDARSHTGDEKTSDRLDSVLSWWLSEEQVISQEESKSGLDIIDNYKNELGDGGRKRLYSLIYDEDQNTLYKVLDEQTSISSIPALRISDNVKKIIKQDDILKPSLDDSYWFNSSTFGDSLTIPKLVFKGDIFRQILDRGHMGEENSEKVLERYKYGMQVTGGVKQSYSKLRDSFVSRLITEQNIQFDNGRDIPIPSIINWKQYLFITALSESGLIYRNDETLTTHLENIIGMNDLSEIEDRRERIEEYIENHNEISGVERETSFVLGALVGRLTVYQSSERDISTTVIDQYPIDSISKPRIKVIYTELTDKLNSYASEEDYNSLYTGYTDILSENLASSNPLEWDIPLEEVRFMYALGLTYGRNDGNF